MYIRITLKTIFSILLLSLLIVPLSSKAERSIGKEEAQKLCAEKVGNLVNAIAEAFTKGAPREAFVFTGGASKFVFFLNQGLDALYKDNIPLAQHFFNKAQDECVNILITKKI